MKIFMQILLDGHLMSGLRFHPIALHRGASLEKKMKRIEKAETNLSDMIIACIVSSKYGGMSNAEKLGLLKSITAFTEAIKEEILEDLKGIK